MTRRDDTSIITRRLALAGPDASTDELLADVPRLSGPPLTQISSRRRRLAESEVSTSRIDTAALERIGSRRTDEVARAARMILASVMSLIAIGLVMIDSSTMAHTARVGEASLFATPFNVRRGEITGSAVEMANGVNVRTAGAVDLTVSESGRLAYVTGGLSPRYGELVYVDRAGRAESIDPNWIENFGGVAVSPDGTRLVVVMRVADFGGQTQLLMKPLDRAAPPVLLTPETNRNDRPRWAPDGRTVLFRSDRETVSDIFSVRADGGGEVAPVLTGDATYLAALYTPDGRWLVYLEGDELYARRLDGDDEPIALGLFPATDDAGAVSPDGRWLAYAAGTGDAVTDTEVFVVPFPNTRDGRWRVSLNGGMTPAWSSDGRELFYRTPARQVMAVTVEPGPTLSLGDRRVLFNLSEAYGAGVSRVFDVMPDGRRFVMIRMREGMLGSELIVVENFFSELREKVGS